MTDSGGQSSASRVGNIRNCENSKKKTAGVKSADLGGRKRSGGNDRVHDVVHVVMSALEGLNGEISDLERAFNAVEEFSNLWDPESLKMGSVDVGGFQEMGAQPGVVLQTVKSD